MEAAWIRQGELELCGEIPLQIWFGPSAHQRYGVEMEAELGQSARIHLVPGSATEGPAVMVLTEADIQGPHQQELLKACRLASPGRPVICGGSRDRDILLTAINSWHAFRVLPSRTSASMVVLAARQAHEALALEVAVEHTIGDLRQQCHRLQRSMDQLQDAQQQLIHSERLATVDRISGVMLPLLQAQARNLDDLERSLSSLGDATLSSLLQDAVGRARSISSLVEQMLSLSRAQDSGQEEDLDAMVEQTFSMMRHEPELRRRTLHLSCHSGARVHVDRSSLSVALMNLLQGAASKADTFALFKVRTFLEESQAVIEIDSGGGGQPARLDPDMSLPLRLSKLAVECQGGSLSCHGAPGAGVRYRVHLPTSE